MASSSQADSEFTRAVQAALRGLYDPDELRKSSLMCLLHGRQPSGASALRGLIIDAIECLKPDPSTSRSGKAWRPYLTLFHRYVEQFSQQEVASSLALSIRQSRREHWRGVRALADYLWCHYGCEAWCSDGPGEDPSSSVPMPAPSREQEIEWLERSAPTESVDGTEIARTVVQIAAPLAETLGVRLECYIPDDLPQLSVHLTSVRQALLGVLTTAIRRVEHGCVEILVDVQIRGIRFRIRPIYGTLTDQHSADYVSEHLELAGELLKLSRGSLSVLAGGDRLTPFTADIVFPMVQQITVLVVDDNTDTLDLFHRYLLGSRYSFVGTTDPKQVLPLALNAHPQIIVLDVMLPGIDGWELLARLREHPETRSIPLIVCTILSEEQLALTLGAASFLRKPVSHSAFLAALDQQAALLCPQAG